MCYYDKTPGTALLFRHRRVDSNNRGRVSLSVCACVFLLVFTYFFFRECERVGVEDRGWRSY